MSNLHMKGLGKKKHGQNISSDFLLQRNPFYPLKRGDDAGEGEGSHGHGGRLRSWRGETRKMDEQEVGLELLQSTLAKLVLKS